MLRFLLCISLLFCLSGCKPIDNQMKRQGKNKVESVLNDPGSGEFRNLKFIEVSSDKKSKEGYVCGQVNAKNGFGAYTGFHKFYVYVKANTLYLIPFLGLYHEESDPVIIGNDISDDIGQMYQEYSKVCHVK